MDSNNHTLKYNLFFVFLFVGYIWIFFKNQTNIIATLIVLGHLERILNKILKCFFNCFQVYELYKNVNVVDYKITYNKTNKS